MDISCHENFVLNLDCQFAALSSAEDTSRQSLNIFLQARATSLQSSCIYFLSTCIFILSAYADGARGERPVDRRAVSLVFTVSTATRDPLLSIDSHLLFRAVSPL